MPANLCEESGEYRYVEDPETLERKTQDVLDMFDNYLESVEDDSTNNWNTSLFKINHDRASMVADRIEKRKDYYKFYHNGLIVSEPRYFGLLIYWILKLQPCYINSENPELPENDIKINESFAYYLLYQTLNRIGAERGVPYITTSDDVETRIMHAFAYWDLSKESLMLLMDLLCDQLEVFGNYIEAQKKFPDAES
ncbi:MAG: hypothetical protein FWE48_07535 [Coriobacteriia bacterium]|nr:hypothetical protein [Coriobacteriia bacterium]